MSDVPPVQEHVLGVPGLVMGPRHVRLAQVGLPLRHLVGTMGPSGQWCTVMFTSIVLGWLVLSVLATWPWAVAVRQARKRIKDDDNGNHGTDFQRRNDHTGPGSGSGDRVGG